MRRPSRRVLLTTGGALGALGMAGYFGFPRLARPAPPDGPLSAAAAQLVDRAWSGLDPARVVDGHVHIVGVGAGGTGCFINPRMTKPLRHPIQYGRFAIYRMATGIRDMARADQEYAERLAALARWGPRHGRYLVLAFDQVHREDGSPDADSSEFYVPNDWVLELARRHSDCFLPAASVHPYRKDAEAEIDRVASLGARAVKWLPNAHRIDPSSPLCDGAYRRLAATGLPLLTHAGLEQAVEAEEAQKLGNPLLLRRALDAGVKVIVAHCASSGDAEDLDASGSPKPRVDAFDLFLRMMDSKAWPGRLFGDVSALTQFNRCDKLARMLERTDLHDRLVNGSDYPLPAINVLVRTGKLESLGLVSSTERELLNEIDRHNPLAFDFAIKRTVRSAGKAFADSVFQPSAELFPRI